MNAGPYNSLCPTCGLPAVVAERCMNGNVACANGHWWSRAATQAVQQRPFAQALYGDGPFRRVSGCGTIAAQPDADLTAISR